MRQLINMTEPELAELMTTMASGIRDTAIAMDVEKPHFVLLLFNDPAVGQYISNCQRADTIKALRETADRLEQRLDVPR